ncbi:MAG TPA: HAD-IIB family hydrolase [Kineosporiaceae bacterium]|nr:HAD-IIB family hydrolase [Kineosporiaceae bacterium]
MTEYSDRPRAVVFDLDDTLAPSKSTINPRMAALLVQLLARVEVCIISGGRFEQFDSQVLRHLEAGEDLLTRLHLMPTCGTRYLSWGDGAWQEIYAEDLDEDEKSRVIQVLREGAQALGLWEEHTWGDVIEDRGSQITFSALGQQAPLAAKAAWDPDGRKKTALREHAARLLPDLEVRSGGSTSVDITRKGIDKAYGIEKLVEQLDTTRAGLLFIGDRLDRDGNDYPVLAAGVACVAVSGWEETADLVGRIVAWLDGGLAEPPFTLLPAL